MDPEDEVTLGILTQRNQREGGGRFHIEGIHIIGPWGSYSLIIYILLMKNEEGHQLSMKAGVEVLGFWNG